MKTIIEINNKKMELYFSIDKNCGSSRRILVKMIMENQLDSGEIKILTFSVPESVDIFRCFERKMFEFLNMPFIKIKNQKK